MLLIGKDTLIQRQLSGTTGVSQLELKRCPITLSVLVVSTRLFFISPDFIGQSL